jgi:CBS domain-containing membrane protein
MNKTAPITDIMTKDVLHVNINNSLSEVEDIVRGKHIRHVPVVKDGNVVGMLSSTDLAKISFINTVDGDGVTNAMFEVLGIEQVMTTNVKTVKKTDTIYEVAQVFASKEFHALPVVDGEKLVGIVSTTDMIKYLLEQF